MKSPFFGSILSEQDQKTSATSPPLSPTEKQTMWRPPIVLSENYPFEAAALLERMHENYLLTALVWNSTFCRLRFVICMLTYVCMWCQCCIIFNSVVWALDEFIGNYSELIDAHFEKCIHFVKVLLVYLFCRFAKFE